MILLSFVTSLALIGTVSSVDEILRVTVYYGALCPYSRHFIVEQLYPAYLVLGKRLSIKYIPFGRAGFWQESDGSWNSTCQHGPKECYGNKVQSCVIELYPEDSQSDFINCAMLGGASNEVVLQWCASDSGISWDAIVECLESGLSDELFRQNGNLTRSRSSIRGFPAVDFNNYFDYDLQSQAYEDFLYTACHRYFYENRPTYCPQEKRTNLC